MAGFGSTTFDQVASKIKALESYTLTSPLLIEEILDVPQLISTWICTSLKSGVIQITPNIFQLMLVFPASMPRFPLCYHLKSKIFDLHQFLPLDLQVPFLFNFLIFFFHDTSHTTVLLQVPWHPHSKQMFGRDSYSTSWSFPSIWIFSFRFTRIATSTTLFKGEICRGFCTEKIESVKTFQVKNYNLWVCSEIFCPVVFLSKFSRVK